MRRHSKKDIELAQLIAEEGMSANEEISRTQATLLRTYPNADYFHLAIANSLTWTGHAIERKNYYPNAVKYLSTGKTEFLTKALKFNGRLGKESLANSLYGFRQLILSLSNLPDLSKSSIEKLQLFQDRCLRAAEQLRLNGRLTGIGPWLFCAPMKIMLAHRRKLWDEDKIDCILMPLGLEVSRGFGRLMHDHSPFVEHVDPNFFDEGDDGGLMAGLATVSIVQDACKRIAQASKSRIIHVNTGLHLYGLGELDEYLEQ